MKFSSRRRLVAFRLIFRFRAWSKRVRLQRNELSLYAFLNLLIHNIFEDEIFMRANAVSYNFILATFPAIIFLFTLIPFVHGYFPEVSTQSIMEFMQSLMPPGIYDIVSATILDILSIPRGGLLTFGFLFSLYLSTNGVTSLMGAFNSCYRTTEKRNFFRTRLTATALMFMMVGALIMAIILLVVGAFVLTYLTDHISEFSNLRLDQFTICFLFVLRFATIFFIFLIAFSFICYFGPSVHGDWYFFSAGSFFATLGILGICYGFSFYITNFATYNKVYGSIGALIALMIWIQLITTVLLIGYEINATLHCNRQKKQKKKIRTNAFR